jgi:hypothetical protein
MITTERTVDELQATLYVVEGHLSPNILERLGMDMGDSASIASLTLFAFSFSAPQYPLDIVGSISRELFYTATLDASEQEIILEDVRVREGSILINLIMSATATMFPNGTAHRFIEWLGDKVAGGAFGRIGELFTDSLSGSLAGYSHSSNFGSSTVNIHELAISEAQKIALSPGCVAAPTFGGHRNDDWYHYRFMLQGCAHHHIDMGIHAQNIYPPRSEVH